VPTIDDNAVCSFESSVTSAEALRIEFANNSAPGTSGEALFDSRVGAESLTTPVGGVGDEAATNTGGVPLVIRTGDLVLRLVVNSTSGLSSGASGMSTRQLAEMVLARL
jgi:hypothetical protein